MFIFLDFLVTQVWWHTKQVWRDSPYIHKVRKPPILLDPGQSAWLSMNEQSMTSFLNEHGGGKQSSRLQGKGQHKLLILSGTHILLSKSEKILNENRKI